MLNMGKLSDMPNIGATLEKKLIEAGIFNSESLRELGSKEAFMRLRMIDNTVCLNMLCALEGAIQGIRWHGLADACKGDLKEFFQRSNLR
jgi:DNA transformation protein